MTDKTSNMVATRGALGALAMTLSLGLSAMAMAESRVQIVHAAPFADTLAGTSVSVTANGATVLEDFQFKDFTEYLVLPAGDYDLAVIPTGASDPAMTASVTLESGVDYTVLATGDGENQALALWPLVDDADVPAEGNLNIRVIHAAPFAASSADTEVSIRTAAGDVVNNLVGVPYFAQSGFFQVPEGTYDLKVASNDGQVNLIDPLAATLPPGLNVTIIAIGDGANQPLGILALPVGELETRAPVDASANGWWASAEGGNEGFILQPVAAQNRLVGTVYTYDLAGSGESRWFTFDSCSSPVEAADCVTPGAFDGRTATAAVYAFSGGQVGGSEPADGITVGFVDFEILDCENATATLELEDGTEVSWDLFRLVQGVPCTLE